jgi:hypothetical protein
MAELLAAKGRPLPDGYFFYLVSIIGQTLSSMNGAQEHEAVPGLFDREQDALELLVSKNVDFEPPEPRTDGHQNISATRGPVGAPRPDASQKPISQGAQVWLSQLKGQILGLRPGAAARTHGKDSKFDPKDVQLFLVRPGQPTLRGSLFSLGELLKKDPNAAAELNARGRTVMVVSGGEITQEDLPTVSEILRAHEISALLHSEGIALSPTPEAKGALRGPTAPAGAKTQAAWLFKRILSEPWFLARSFAAAFTWPIASEIVGGLASKALPFAFNAAVAWTMIGISHPFLLVATIVFSLLLEGFHGLFLNTWANFQMDLKKFRGDTYQTLFSWFYFQGTGAIFRALYWAAHPGSVVPPWQFAYWEAIGFISVVGTYCGVLGINGLNTLYSKGVINRWQRSGIQQMRDLLFLLGGPFFAAGAMHYFWIIFIVQQGSDLLLAFLGMRAHQRMTLYVAQAPIGDSMEFKTKYLGGEPFKAPLMSQAFEAVRGLSIMKLVVVPFNVLRRWWDRQFGSKNSEKADQL